MTPKLWKPYAVLGITNREGENTSCAGRWWYTDDCDEVIDDDSQISVRHIISTLGSTPPDKKNSQHILNRLASLLFCDDCRPSDYISCKRLVAGWKRSIGQEEQLYHERLARDRVETRLKTEQEVSERLEKTVKELRLKEFRDSGVMKNLRKELIDEKLQSSCADKCASLILRDTSQEVVSLKSQLQVSKDLGSVARQELQASTVSNDSLSTGVSRLRRELGSSDSASKEVTVKLGKLRTEHNILLSINIELEDALKQERIATSIKVGQLETTLQSHFDNSSQRIQEFAQMKDKLKADTDTLATMNEDLHALAARRQKCRCYHHTPLIPSGIRQEPLVPVLSPQFDVLG